MYISNLDFDFFAMVDQIFLACLDSFIEKLGFSWDEVMEKHLEAAWIEIGTAYVGTGIPPPLNTTWLQLDNESNNNLNNNAQDGGGVDLVDDANEGLADGVGDADEGLVAGV